MRSTNKATKEQTIKADVYTRITEIIIEKLECGIIPWKREFAVHQRPQNAITKKNYRGINALLLSLTSDACNYKSPYWVTYKQAIELGGNIKKGEKASPIVYWITYKDGNKEIESSTLSNSELDEKVSMFPKFYTVFNLEQTENIDLVSYQNEIILNNDVDPILLCENIVSNMPKRPEIITRGFQPCYAPSNDTVYMPEKTNFTNMEAYYSTLFHELAHCTGHETRLSRNGITGLSPFRSVAYSKEELIAEFTAAFLCTHAEIETEVIDNNAAYIQGWLSVLKNDKKILMNAASQAQKACDFILGINEKVE